MSSTGLIGKPFIELLTVESTNNYAMGLVREGMAQAGTAVFAHEQTRGKGQRSRNWLSQQGKNIALSLILQPSDTVRAQPFLLSMACANAVWRLLDNYTSTGLKIKWPNDLYWRDRKAAGILIENLWQGSEWKYAVAGIGININQDDFGEIGEKAVSLKEITGQEYEPVALARELCSILQTVLEELNHQPRSVRDFYRQHLYKKGEMTRFKKEARVFEARVLDVTDDGDLVVYHSMEEYFSVGGVEWI